MSPLRFSFHLSPIEISSLTSVVQLGWHIHLFAGRVLFWQGRVLLLLIQVIESERRLFLLAGLLVILKIAARSRKIVLYQSLQNVLLIWFVSLNRVVVVVSCGCGLIKRSVLSYIRVERWILTVVVFGRQVLWLGPKEGKSFRVNHFERGLVVPLARHKGRDTLDIVRMRLLEAIVEHGGRDAWVDSSRVDLVVAAPLHGVVVILSLFETWLFWRVCVFSQKLESISLYFICLLWLWKLDDFNLFFLR